MIDRTLYVIAVVSNPVRWASRAKLYREFAERMAVPGVQLVTVEQAFGDRPFVLTQPDSRWHVQVRAGAESEVWVKESLINIGFRHLAGQAPEWRYAAWIDADVQFVRPDWASETVEALQHHRVVQPFSHAIDLMPSMHHRGDTESFCYAYWNEPELLEKCAGRGYGKPPIPAHKLHPGYAWALRREVWEGIKGLIDWCPMGSADHHMAWAFVGKIAEAIDGYATSPAYRRRAHEFQARCEEHVMHDLGYVPGTLLHHWHGKKRERFYVERKAALAKTGFCPDRDLTYNAQGLLVLQGKNLKLRDALRRYFRSRNEDSVDID